MKKINLKEKVSAIVTKKGAEIKINKWKEGDVINIHPELFDYFQSKGLIEKVNKKSKNE